MTETKDFLSFDYDYNEGILKATLVTGVLLSSFSLQSNVIQNTSSFIITNPSSLHGAIQLSNGVTFNLPRKDKSKPVQSGIDTISTPYYSSSINAWGSSNATEYLVLNETHFGYNVGDEFTSYQLYPDLEGMTPMQTEDQIWCLDVDVIFEPSIVRRELKATQTEDLTFTRLTPLHRSEHVIDVDVIFEGPLKPKTFNI